MRVTRRVFINTIGFLVLAVLLSLLFAIQILPTVFGSSFSIYGIFETAGGVFTNQEVTYRGIQIGRVGEMTLTRDAVKIEMVIESDYDHIPKRGTHARILYKSAVGEQFIDLLPETDKGPFFSGGETISLDNTSTPIQTEDLLRELNAVFESVNPENLAKTIDELGTGLEGRGRDLKQLILALDALARIGAQQKDVIASGLGAGADVQDAFNSTREDFVSAADALATVAEVLERRRGEFGQTLENTDKLDKEIIALLKNRKAELNQVLADAATITRLTHAQRDDLDQILQHLGFMLGDIYKAYSAPYFIFNLLSSGTGDECQYSPSSRPVRPVTDTSFKQPETYFECSGGDPPEAQSARLGVGDEPPVTSEAQTPSLSPFTLNQLDRVSWLELYGMGY